MNEEVADLYVDQLVSIEDVTKRVRSSVHDYQNDEEEAAARAGKQLRP